jgi:hypothetical protein
VNSGVGRLKFVDENVRLAKQNPSPERDSSPSTDSSASSSPPSSASASQIARLNKSAIVSHATGAFWLAYVPVEIANTPLHCVTDIASSGWIRHALHHTQQDPGLEDAVAALALSRMSRQTGDARARKEALMFYGSTVRHVRRSILDPDKLNDDSLLATVMLLAIFELHEGTYRRDTAWGAHVDGASKIINARGGSAISTHFGRILYLSHLRDELVYGISTRGKSRKSIGETTYLPDDDDTMEVRLARILSTMPVIMEEADRMRSVRSPTRLIKGLAALLGMVAAVLAALEDFCNTLALQAHPAPLYIELPSQLYAALPSDSPERVFSEYLHFSSLSLADPLLTAWSSMLLLHSTIFLAWENTRIHQPSIHIDTVLPIINQIPNHTPTYVDSLTLRIAQSLEYFILPENGLLGAEYVKYAIPIAMGYMAFWKWPEQMWFKVLFKRMKELNLGVEGFLADMFRGQELRLVRPLDDDDGSERRRMKVWNGSVFSSVTATYESKEEEGDNEVRASEVYVPAKKW